MSRRVELPTVSSLRKTDCVLICDSLTDFIDFAEASHATSRRNGKDHWTSGGKTPAEVLRDARNGDISLVASSDKIIDELEGKVNFRTSNWKSIDSVTGGAVNVGAYCAGVPLCMKQRRRVAAASAPLSVVVDLTVSSSLSHEQIACRGSAILALTRLLTGVRPVKLYIAAAMGGGSADIAATGVLIPVDTTPLDLATVANAMTTTGFVRMLGYDAIDASEMSNGLWPLRNIEEYRRLGKDFWERFCGDTGSELLFVPPAFAEDQALDNPLQWLTTKLREYGGLEIEE
jgi:hypothetical protein